MKLCTAIDHQSVSLNIKKLHKIKDVIDNDDTILRLDFRLSEKTQNKTEKYN